MVFTKFRAPLFEAISKWEKLYYWLYCPVYSEHSVEMHCNWAQAGNTDWKAERIL